MNARIAALGLLLPLAAGSAVAAEEGSSVKDAAKAAVSSAIETGKNLLGGVSEGITSGRQSAQGADGAKPDDVTVPAKAGIRQTFVFEGGAEGIKAVRLWGKDLPVK